jgi:hypothetical protein
MITLSLSKGHDEALFPKQGEGGGEGKMLEEDS